MGRRNTVLALDMSANHEERACRTSRNDSTSSDDAVRDEPGDDARSASPLPPISLNHSAAKPLTAKSSQVLNGNGKKESTKKLSHNFSVASLLGRRDEPDTEDDEEDDNDEAVSGRRDEDNSSPENIAEQKLAFQRRLYESCLPEQMASLHNGFALMSNDSSRFLHPLAHQMPWLPNLQHFNQAVNGYYAFNRQGTVNGLSSRKYLGN